MPAEYQSKMCPRLTAAAWANASWRSVEPLHCREDACQWWWKCREPQGEAGLPPGTLTDEQIYLSNMRPRFPEYQPECEESLEARATRLAIEITALAGWKVVPYPGSRHMAEATQLALAALREAKDWGAGEMLDNLDSVVRMHPKRTIARVTTGKEVHDDRPRTAPVEKRHRANAGEYVSRWASTSAWTIEDMVAQALADAEDAGFQAALDSVEDWYEGNGEGQRNEGHD